MNKIKYIFLMITILIIIFQGQFLKAQKSLQIQGELSKSEFLVAEKIDLFLEIKNISNSVVKKYLSYSIDIKIFDNNNNEIYREGSKGNAFSAGKNEYKINEEWVGIVQLSDLFGKRLNGITTSRYLDPGKYYIKITHQSGNIKESSGIINFRVIEPTGDEKIVYNKFNDLCNGNNKYKDTRFIEDLYSLHESYPNSVYSPMFLDIIGSYYYFVYKDFSKGDQMYNEIVEKYPWSPLGKGMLYSKLIKMSSNMEKEAYINKLILACKNNPMQKILKKKIIDIKNNVKID